MDHSAYGSFGSSKRCVEPPPERKRTPGAISIESSALAAQQNRLAGVRFAQIWRGSLTGRLQRSQNCRTGASGFCLTAWQAQSQSTPDRNPHIDAAADSQPQGFIDHEAGEGTDGSAIP